MAGIYLHIPFCKRRCIYCDFYSTTMEQRKDEYIEALCRELEMRRDYTGEPSVATVYFGGGTPSQLEERHFHRVFETIGNNYRLHPDAEITLEANPDDLTPDYVAMLRRLPFNRISIGIQTFNDETLRLLHRRHTASQAVEAVRRCQEAGFGNISIDLMYGLPGESRDSWANDLQQAIGLQVQHISAYHLIYEEGTELWELRRRHRVEEVDEDSSLTFFSMLIDRLRDAGFEHYEISNYALPGFRSRHNSNYWNKTPYIGFGASAHSYLSGRRSYNPGNIKLYVAAINDGVTVSEIEEESIAEQYDEEVMLRLRTKDGIDAGRLRSTYGEEYYAYFLNAVRGFVDSGLVERHGDVYRLSRKGVMLSDMVIRELMYDYE